MLRNVRNFWLTLKVDGREEKIETGPRSKEGGFNLEIKIRENGGISEKRIEILGEVIGERLRISVLPFGGSVTAGNLFLNTER